MGSSWDLVKWIESALGVSVDSGWAAAVLTTSAVIIACVALVLWRRSGERRREANPSVSLKTAPAHPEAVEGDVDEASGKTKVTILFGTQTGTAEGFAKVLDFP